MLTYAQLAELEHVAHDSLVLNAYVDATELDAVARRSWRSTLANAMAATGKAQDGAPHADRTAYARAVERLEALVKDLHDDMDGQPGWVAFVTADDVLYASPTATAPSASLAWRVGIATSPYVRLLRDDPVVTLAMVDVRGADLYRWSAGTLQRVEQIQAHAHVGRAGHMGDAPHQGFHTGTRGMTLTDAAQRALDAGVDRMVRDVAAQIGTIAHVAGWIVLVGNRTVALDTMKHLSKSEQKRAMYVTGLGTDPSESELVRAAGEGRAQLEGARDIARVAELIDRAAARRRGVLGYGETLDAVNSGAVRDVLVTAGFLDRAPERAEALTLALLANGARLVEVAGEGAARLDAECDGIGATLRFQAATAGGKSAARTAAV